MLPLWDAIGIVLTRAPETLKRTMLPFFAVEVRDHEKSIEFAPLKRVLPVNVASLAETNLPAVIKPTVVGNENGTLLFTVVSA